MQNRDIDIYLMAEYQRIASARHTVCIRLHMAYQHVYADKDASKQQCPGEVAKHELALGRLEALHPGPVLHGLGHLTGSNPIGAKQTGGGGGRGGLLGGWLLFARWGGGGAGIVGRGEGCCC